MAATSGTVTAARRTVVLVAVAVVVIAAAAWYGLRPAAPSAAEITSCAPLYQGLRSRADTLRVDSLYPSQADLRHLKRATCGALRATFPKYFHQ